MQLLILFIVIASATNNDIIKTLYSQEASPSLFSRKVIGVFEPINNVSSSLEAYDCFHGLGRIEKTDFALLFEEGNDVIVNALVTIGSNTFKHIGTFTIMKEKIISFDIVVTNFASQMENVFKDISLIDVYCHASARAGCEDYFDCHTKAKTIKEGTWYNLHEDTLTYRTYYAILAKERPEIYCKYLNK